MWSGKGQSEGLFPAWLRQWVGPLLLILGTFPLSFTIIYANMATLPGGAKNDINGSMWELLCRIWSTRGQLVVDAFNATWPQGEKMTTVATMLLAFSAFQLVIVRAIPGPVERGPISPKGHIPQYVNNGLASFVVAVGAFLLLTVGFGWVKAADILDLYPSMLAVMSVVSLVFCALLYVKGVYFPSGPDCDSNGNFVLDFYGGRELYPRIFGWDVKQFTNCRFGLMAWAILPIAFVLGTMEKGHGFTYAQGVNLVLQLVYLAKFYDWETGYFSTMDIMHDKAGYYICWGCLVWVPSIYVIHSYYISQQILAGTFQDLSLPVALAILALGVISVYVNYDADLQRRFVRSTNAKCKVWGADPVIIRAKYTVEGSKDQKESILLASGWWGVSRHFHYVPEILAALCWSLPGGTSHFMPYVYVVFLTILLVDRAFRDDSRCAEKYGSYWQEYCRRVPYKIIPGLI